VYINSSKIFHFTLPQALKYAGYTLVCLCLSGCIPTIEKTYTSPEVHGVVEFFYPESSEKFVPIARAKIYHERHPETAVYSDESGRFVLPATVKTEFKLLMAGHAFAYYPVVIEKDSNRSIVFARATMHMRNLERIDSGSIILMQPGRFNAQNINASVKSQLPCDQGLIQSLDQSVATSQRLTAAFNDGALASSNDYERLVQHCQQLESLQAVASRSCRWQEFNSVEQREKIAQTREYFSAVQSVIEQSPGYLDSLNLNNNSAYNQ